MKLLGSNRKNLSLFYLGLSSISMVTAALINYFIWYDFQAVGLSVARSNKILLLHELVYGLWLGIFFIQKWQERRSELQLENVYSEPKPFPSRLLQYLPSSGVIVGLSIPYFALKHQTVVAYLLRGPDLAILVHALVTLGAVAIFAMLDQLRVNRIFSISIAVIYTFAIGLQGEVAMLALKENGEMTLNFLNQRMTILLGMTVGLIMLDALVYKRRNAPRMIAS
jgi:hypothetical protein